jgi:hypothetical protein
LVLHRQFDRGCQHRQSINIAAAAMSPRELPEK